MAEEPTVSDGQLLHRMRRGDQSAFAAVYECYQGRIFRFALHMTGNSSIAEEVTQEAFMQLIRKTAAYDPKKGSLSAYLFGVARNLARRRNEEQSIEALFDDCDELEMVEASDAAIDDVLSSAESLDLLRKALLGLPESYREAVVLCDLEEMSYEQASRVMECPPGTVASRLHRAHGMLRAKLNRAADKSCRRGA